MNGYVTQSRDTSFEAEQLQFEHYRRMSAPEKVHVILELGRAADAVCLQGLRHRHASASPRELELRLAALKYGRDLVERAFGWRAPEDI